MIQLLLGARGMNSMNDKCFVDTNILVYAHDRSAGLKHQRAQMLLENCGIRARAC